MPIDKDSASVALADLGSNAIDLFCKVEKALKESTDKAWPVDLFVAESERFDLWAANMGLFVAGHGSLDYRVREAEGLAQTLRGFMQDLINSLEDVLRIYPGAIHAGATGMDETRGECSTPETTGDENEDEDENEGEEESDMELLLDGIRDPINRLFKISTKMRNPSTRLGSSKAINHRQVDEDTGVDFLEAMKKADVDYVKSVFLEYRKVRARQDHHPAEAPGGPSGDNDDEVWEPIRTVLIQEQERERTGTNSYLIERIAQANVRRRQQFAYWAKHRDKLNKHTKAYQAQHGRLQSAQRQGTGEPVLEPIPGTVPSITTATRLDIAQLEISDNHSNWTVSEYAPSTQATHASVAFPPPPKRSRNTPSEKFFECPYCFFFCPNEVLAEKAWKAHLIHDMRPYICTYEDCRNPAQLYDSRQDWVQHENSEHRKVWRCREHSDQVFKKLETYKRHLQKQHGGFISGEASLTRIIQASESVSDVAERTCPVCMVELKTGRKIETHIALHLERFAGFALPRSVNNEDDGSNADSGKANRVDKEGSRDDDFEGGFELHSEMDASETQIKGLASDVGGSSPPHGVGTTGGILQDLQVSDDDDGLSSESSRAHHDTQQSTDDKASSDDFEVGKWCTDFEKYEETEQRLRDALEQTEKTMGSEHPDTLDKMQDLATVLRGQMKYMEAEQICRKILDLREKALGREHLDTLAGMNNLGHVLHLQGKYIESEQVERDLLELRKKVLGREDPGVLLSMANLASTLSKLGRLEEAEELGVEAMETRVQVLGPAHIDTLTSMSNVAFTLHKLGRWEEAERRHVEVMEICKKEFGLDHPITLTFRENLAGVFWTQDKFEAAEKLYVEVLETRKRVQGPTHPETFINMHSLALTWHSQGRIADAIALMDSCAQLRFEVFGPEHLHTATSIKVLEDWR